MSGFDSLLHQESGAPFDDETRVAQTHKLLKRTFGDAAGELGTVEIRDGQPTLAFQYGGAAHTLTWSRQPGGAIVWFLDGNDKPLVLGDQDRALRVLANALGG